MQLTEQGSYKHYKGGNYTLLVDATDTSDGSEVVVYVSEENNKYYVRSASEFHGSVMVNGNPVKRFTKIVT